MDFIIPFKIAGSILHSLEVFLHLQVFLTAFISQISSDLLLCKCYCSTSLFFFPAVHPVEMHRCSDGAGELSPTHESHQQTRCNSKSHSGKVELLLNSVKVSSFLGLSPDFPV